MTPDLGEPFPTSWPGRPPHLSGLDAEVWQAWRALNLGRFRRFYFDVAVGEGAGPALAAGDEFERGFSRLTRKRIDVVAETDDGWTLIEAKSQSTAANAGQLLTYRELWQEDPPDARPITLLLITDRADRDIRFTLDRLGIPVEIVEVPGR